MIKRTIYIGNPGYVSLKQKQLVIKNKEGEILSGQLPVEDIGVLMLDHPQITITHGAIQELLKNNAALVSCDDKHLPFALMLPIDKHHLVAKRHRVQIGISEPLKKQLWKQTVMAKIRNQAALLNKKGISTRGLDYLQRTVKSGDERNNEAHAARIYWNDLINGFTRDRDGEEPNGLLNYGYAVLRAVVARALVSSGLIPSIGIYHRNQYNPYCLADDVMEPFRPFVDELALELFKEAGDPDFLDATQKRKLLAIPTIDVKIRKTKSPLGVAVSTVTSSLYECFEGSRRKILYPEFV